MFTIVIMTQDSTGFTEMFTKKNQTIEEVNHWVSHPYLAEIKITKEDEDGN